jgi:hypothetical protein
MASASKHPIQFAHERAFGLADTFEAFLFINGYKLPYGAIVSALF